MVIASNICLLLLLLSNKQKRGQTRVRCYGNVVVSISADKQCKLMCEEDNFYSRFQDLFENTQTHIQV